MQILISSEYGLNNEKIKIVHVKRTVHCKTCIAVYGCNSDNQRTSEIRFFNFPKGKLVDQQYRRKAWIEFCKRKTFKRGCPQKSNIRRPRLKNRFCSNFAQIYLIISENAPDIFLGQMLF